MFRTHVAHRLAALIDGQLSAGESARVQAHVSRCHRCSTTLERVRASHAFLEQLPMVEAPASIWTAIEARLDHRQEASGGWWEPFVGWRALAAAVVVAAIGGLVAWQVTRGPALHDVVRVDVSGGETAMAIGEWIETGGAAAARVRIGQIGTVDVGPNTRLQVLAARPDEHRLNLARGMLSAVITAPPRLFFVETPSSTVVDLGCAYTMEVDEAGVGILRVTSGWASLEWEGRESIVPAGASAPTRPDLGPGTPVFDDASERLRRALTAFDYEGGGMGAASVVLDEARDRDTLTLWHLLSRVDGADRVRVFDRLVALTPLPAGVARDKALALDRDTLTRWREELAWTW